MFIIGKGNPHIGNTEEIASMAEFLLTTKARGITGQIMHVDGGISTLRI